MAYNGVMETIGLPSPNSRTTMERTEADTYSSEDIGRK